MDKHQVVIQLASAERRVKEGDRLLAEQRELIEKMVREGQNVTAARSLLEECEQTQRSHIAERDRLRKLLAESVPRNLRTD